MFETTLGTPPYMAPEFYNSMEYGIEVDIWALGVMMHECLFGELFFLKNATT
jgi:calcium-dependent protein kinase